MRKLLPILFFTSCAVTQAQVSPQKIAGMKADLAGQIDAMKKQAQVMVDTVYSFGELGFHEVETSKYLSDILEKEGFEVERGVAGIPTAFIASFGGRESPSSRLAPTSTISPRRRSSPACPIIRR